MLSKIKKSLKKEFLIYLGTLLVLIIIVHSDMLSDPMARFEHIEDYTHPLLYSFAIYSVIFVIRKAIDLVVGFFEKKAQ